MNPASALLTSSVPYDDRALTPLFCSAFATFRLLRLSIKPRAEICWSDINNHGVDWNHIAGHILSEMLLGLAWIDICVLSSYEPPSETRFLRFSA